MKRLQILFAVFLFCLFPLMWRLADYVVIFTPNSYAFAGAFTLLFIFFFFFPLKLLMHFKNGFLALAALVLMVLLYNMRPHSRMATLHPELSHCGALTYTGFLYPIHEYLNEANADDLIIRNQLCWIRKIIRRVPFGFPTQEEQAAYTMLTHKKLMLPKDKFQVALPLIALLHGELAMKAGDPKFLFDSLQFWREHYTLQLKNKNYGWWEWPHSSWIKMEYGLIENNWESILENIVYEEE